MDLIIFTHPDNIKSHCAAILRHVQGRLKQRFRQVEVIDLYADGFDPVLRLNKESEGKLAMVRRYQELVAKADRLIFIHPVWWYNMPAMLKGFIEHVFNSGFAYEFKAAPDSGTIIERKFNGKEAIVIRTYGRSEAEARARNDPPRLVLDKSVLEFCGVRVKESIEWFEVKGPALLPTDIVNRIDKAILE
ncbi:MAG: NAD(P)H-dependent oxidoreductase [Candidatus Micrarchaeota archaeon]